MGGGRELHDFTSNKLQTTQSSLFSKHEKGRTFTQRERPPKGVYLRYLGMDLQFISEEIRVKSEEFILAKKVTQILHY